MEGQFANISISDITDVVSSVLNYSDCEGIETSLFNMIDMRKTLVSHISATEYIIPAALLCASIPLLLAGARIVRPVSALSAAAVAFVGALSVIRQSNGMECATRLIIAAALSATAGLAALYLFKVGLFVLGAAASAAVVHYVFILVPEDNGLPSIGPRNVIYWGSMCASFVVGGLVVRYNSSFVLELCTSAVGGSAAAYAITGFGEASDADIPEWSSLTIGACAALFGFALQRHWRIRKTRPHAEKESENIA